MGKKTVKVSKIPTGKVQCLSSPARVSKRQDWKSTWKIPANDTSNSNAARANGFRVVWTLGVGKGKKNPTITRDRGLSNTNDTCQLNSGWKFKGMGKVTRSSFYPYKHKTGKKDKKGKPIYASNPKLTSIGLDVYEKNAKGRAVKPVHTSVKIGTPPAPKLGTPSLNKSNGVVSCHITQDRRENSNNPCERTWHKKSIKYPGQEWKTYEGYTKSADFYLSHNLAGWQDLEYDEYIKVRFEAKAQGYNGDSSKPYRDIFISYPKQATISSVTLDLKGKWKKIAEIPIATRRSTDEKVTVHFKPNSTTEHPVSGVKLQKLVDVPYTKASDIPASANWEDTELVDDASCTALSIGAADIVPTKGKQSWLRIKSWNKHEDIFYRYSEPKRLSDLYIPEDSAENDRIKLISVDPGEDGTSAVALIVWDDGAGEEPSDGTEVTWSTDSNAWRSTQDPMSHEFSWTEGEWTPDPNDSSTWHDESDPTSKWPNHAVLYIKGLEEGVPYYVRARRYKEGEESRTYSQYAELEVPVVPSYTPPQVSLNGPGFVARGKPVTLNWSLSGDANQTKWELLCENLRKDVVILSSPAADGESVSIVYIQAWTDADGTVHSETRTDTFEGDGETTSYQLTYPMSEVTSVTVAGTARTYATSVKDVVVSSGEDAIGSCIVTAERIDGILPDAESISFVVKVSTGGSFIESPVVTVGITDPPVVSPIDMDTVVGHQSPMVSIFCDQKATLQVVVNALGATGAWPDGNRVQMAGDAVYSDVLELEWTEEEPGYSTGFSLPDGLDLWDGGSYEIVVTAVSPETGLASDPVSTLFVVEWDHQAPKPSDDLDISSFDETDDDGFRTRGVVIKLAPPVSDPELNDPDDVYDVYRITQDGSYLIANGVAQNATVTDMYAPFGSSSFNSSEHRYRIAVRTVDGDVNWEDFYYILEGYDLRIDFGDEYIELPWNVNIGDKYQKDFESRSHLGSGTPEGYWNENVSRTASFSSDVVRVTERSQIEKLRKLGRYDGPCFVRTSNGSAYTANVEVGGIDENSKAVVVAASLDATEIGLVQDYAAYIELPVEPGKTSILEGEYENVSSIIEASGYTHAETDDIFCNLHSDYTTEGGELYLEDTTFALTWDDQTSSYRGDAIVLYNGGSAPVEVEVGCVVTASATVIEFEVLEEAYSMAVVTADVYILTT